MKPNLTPDEAFQLLCFDIGWWLVRKIAVFCFWMGVIWAAPVFIRWAYMSIKAGEVLNPFIPWIAATSRTF